MCAFFNIKLHILYLIYLFFQSLRILKQSDLKPYIAFIAPPNLEKLKNIRQRQGAKVSVSIIFLFKPVYTELGNAQHHIYHGNVAIMPVF